MWEIVFFHNGFSNQLVNQVCKSLLCSNLALRDNKALNQYVVKQRVKDAASQSKGVENTANTGSQVIITAVTQKASNVANDKLDKQNQRQ